jgi:hypothetical protein
MRRGGAAVNIAHVESAGRRKRKAMRKPPNAFGSRCNAVALPNRPVIRVVSTD